MKQFIAGDLLKIGLALALAFATAATAFLVDDLTPFLRVFTGAFGLAFTVIGLGILFYETDRQSDLLAMHLEERRAKLNPVELPKPVVPFPPVSFVEFLFNNLNEIGEFPTVETCTDKTKGNFPHPKVVEWFAQAEAAGAIQGRVERQKSGRPALAWPRERWLQAARDAATLR